MTSIWKPVGFATLTAVSAASAGVGLYASLAGRTSSTDVLGAAGAVVGAIGAAVGAIGTCRSASAYRAARLRDTAKLKLPEPRPVKLPNDAAGNEHSVYRSSSSGSLNDMISINAVLASMGSAG